MKYFYISLLVLLSLPAIYAAESQTKMTTAEAIAVLSRLVDTYEAKIQALEAENAAMRFQLEKAGLTNFPVVSALSGTVSTTPTPPVNSSTGISSVSTASGVSLLAQIAVQYNPMYAGFMDKITRDWDSIKPAYALPETALISTYEFVLSGALDHVFVDIVSSASYTGTLYEWKILYEFDKATYQRKLVGFFELHAPTGKYITTKGVNPYAGVRREIIKNPLVKVNLTTAATSSTGSTSTLTGTVTPSTSVPTMAEIQKAYADKRYLSVISLSNIYLLVNAPNTELLRMRYRTYFIIGKYTESLGEIKKIQSIQGGTLERTIACDAQVIATYSKDQKLIDSYSKMCKG